MMAKSKSVSLLFLYLIGIFPAIAQVYSFRKYQVEDGLSNNTVSSVLQDRKGFVWIGTRDGLNRYDGNHFKIFRYESDKPESLRGDFVHCIVESPEGTIWVGTDKGLFRYDEQKETFHLLNESINYVRDIKISQDRKLWFISGKSFYTGTTLYCYSFQTNAITAYPQHDNSNATSICITDTGTLWVSTSSGLISKYCPKNDSFVSYNAIADNDNSLPKTIEKICAVSNNLILIGTSRRGLLEFNTKQDQSRSLNLKNPDNSSLFVRDILKYSDEEYWIGTETGVFIYNTKTDKYINLRKNLNDPFSLSNNTVYSLWQDYEGGVWIATFYGGLNYYSKQNSFFNKYFPTAKSNSLSGNIVREICEDNEGNLWVGTEDAGLNKMNPSTQTFTRYSPGSKSGISYSNIHGLKAIDNELWIGTFEHGLDIMDIKTGKIIRHYSSGSDSNSLKSNFIVTIFETSQKEILIGTYSGLYKFNRRQKNFSLVREVSADAFVYSLYEDHNGTIWVGTIGDGVYYFNSMTQQHSKLDVRKLKQNDQIRNNVVGIIEDSKHVIWFATEGSGIACYNSLTRSVYNYSTANGLPSNFIYKIVEDRIGNLWISSSNGLVRFDQATKSFQTYNTSSGIFNNQFNYNSGFIDRSGNLYFGSLGCLLRFDPKTLLEDNFSKGIFITNLQVNNKQVEIGDNKSPLKQSLLMTKEVTLNYNQAYINLDFAALSFTSPKSIEYAYKLIGLDKDWTIVKTNRRVYFTNLSPGKYTFVVKALNINGSAKNREAKLDIYITPPWWKTTLAYIVYSLLTLGILYFLFRSYRNRVRFQNEIRFARHQYEKEKEVMDSKLEFFTAVAHEIRTPLTLIVGPLERMIDLSDDFPKLKSSLHLMENNTNQLLRLTTQLLDFRKIESKAYSISFSEENISEMVLETFESFKPLAENKKLQYEFDNSQISLCADVDGEALQKILNNLFSNAIKYAKHTVSVNLKHLEDTSSFSLEVANDGPLIPSELHEKIFELFFRVKNATLHQSGTGMGLTLSRSLAELHGGSLLVKKGTGELNTFILCLPLKQFTINTAMSKCYEV